MNFVDLTILLSCLPMGKRQRLLCMDIGRDAETPPEKMKRKCQFMYWNLLMLMEKNREVSAPHVFREWDETARCDKLCTDFSSVRNLLEVHMGPSTVKNIRSYSTTEMDHDRALQSLIHYGEFQRERLVKALQPAWKMYYYTVYRAEGTLASIGLISTGYVGLQGVTRVFQRTVKTMAKS